MAGIHYRLYKDSDADKVMTLFRRNRFYLGKRPADTDDFRYAWRARGGLFALVGETEEGRIILYVAVYPTGDRTVCEPHQVVMGGLLVDEDYRCRLYSMTDMYRLLLEQVFSYPRLTTLIGEVDDYRRQSLLLQRYLGSVMLNGVVPAADHIYCMYNFLPGLKHLYDADSAIRHVPRMSMLPKVDKRRITIPDPVRDGRFLDYAYQPPYAKMRVCFHIPSGLVSRVATEGRWSAGLEDDLDTLFFHFDQPDVHAEVCFVGTEGIIGKETVICTADETWHRSLPKGTEKIHLAVEGEQDHFWLEPGVMKQTEYKNRPVLAFGPAEFDPETGFLIFSGYFIETWPFMEMPYLIGSLRPLRQPGLEIEQSDGKSMKVTVSSDKGKLVREYISDDNQIRIHTWYTGNITSELNPLFQINILNQQMTCMMDPLGQNPVNVPLDMERDLKTGSPEIPFVLLGDKKNERTSVKIIRMNFPDGAYEIQFAQPTPAFLQFDYLNIQPLPVSVSKGVCDFGELRITRLDSLQPVHTDNGGGHEY